MKNPFPFEDSCCSTLYQKMDAQCLEHSECPDELVEYFGMGRGFGLVTHDDNGNRNAVYHKIKFCPWCGANLEELVWN